MMPTRIGPYPVERELGRGGMGIVYLGRDARLGRPVAIKVLPDGFADDPDRLARFEREARLLASLTHPNVAGIYGLEESDGRRFLALEYVPGETLAQRLERGALPLDDTLEICRQIACALEAAHEAGIVHRDLKPGNVKLTDAGEVKVLDFGLAKSSAGSPDSNPDLSHSPTVTRAATGMGVILGTAAYMSPEQARGRAVDRRTDIWSFGCVLYECLTGEQAFAGETVSDIIARILQGEPEGAKLPEKTPARLRQLLARCLEKDAKRRLRDIGEARIELEELQGARVSGSSGLRSVVASPVIPAIRETRPRPVWHWLVAAGALLAMGTTVGFGVRNFGGPGSSKATPLRFTVGAPPHRELNVDPNEHPISPDGTLLLLGVGDSTGQQSLWIRPLGSLEAREIAGTRGASLPFWSPDGQQIGFFADSKLKRVRIAGGSPEIVADAPTPRGGAWSPKGIIVFAPIAAGPLLQMPAAGGTPQPVTTLDRALGETAHRWPSFLPDGEHFLYASLPAKNGQFTTWLGSLRSKRRIKVLTGSSVAIFAAPHHVVFNRGSALMAQRFDPRSGRVLGEPVPIGEPSAATNMSASAGVSASRNGVLAWIGAGPQEKRLAWLDRSGREVGHVDVAADRWFAPTPSPDGRRAAVTQESSGDDTDLWIVDLERGIANRITFGTGNNIFTIWSPDGREILYASNREGPRNLYRRNADGSGSDRLVYRSTVAFKNPTAWLRDGSILFDEIGDATGWNILVLPPGGGTPKPWLATPFNERNSALSPDEKWVAYVSDESGIQQLYVQSFPEPAFKQQVTKTGAFFVSWSADGRELIVIRPDLTIISVPVTPGPELRFGPPRELFRLPPNTGGGALMPNGSRFLISVPADDASPEVSVAMHWSDALK